MPYGDEHRMFLQGIMARGALASQEVIDMYTTILERCDVEPPDTKDALLSRVANTVREINAEISDLNLVIVKIFDETSYRKVPYFVLISTLDRSEDPNMLTVKAMVRYKAYELEYLKLLISSIMESSRKEINPISAINMFKKVEGKTVSLQEADSVLRKLVEDKWLVQDPEDKSFSFAPRLVAELGPYLKAHYEDVRKCVVCRKTVIKATSCPNCHDEDTVYHRYCKAALKMCSKCKAPLQHVVDRVSSKRPRSSQIPSDDSE